MLLERHEAVPGYGHHEFFLWDGGRQQEIWAAQETWGVDAVEIAARDGTHVASAHGLIVVVAPAFADYVARVVIERWDADPGVGADDDACDLAEVDLDLTGPVALGAGGLADDVIVRCEPGKYRARIAGRGFDEAVAWELAGAQEGGPAWWTVRLWPRHVDQPVRSIRIWS